MTQGEYLKRIEDGLLDDIKKVSSSKEAASELIDFLGIRHLLIPMPEEKIKATEEERAKAK